MTESFDPAMNSEDWKIGASCHGAVSSQLRSMCGTSSARPGSRISAKARWI
jgi:hypothetical protein